MKTNTDSLYKLIASDISDQIDTKTKYADLEDSRYLAEDYSEGAYNATALLLNKFIEFESFLKSNPTLSLIDYLKQYNP